MAYIDKCGSPEDKHEWDNFFKKIIPQAPLTEGNCPLRHDSYLHKLYAEYGGPPRRKCRDHERTRYPISKFTEPMVFPGAAYTKIERDATAQFAVSQDFTNSLLVDKGDLKRTTKKRNRKALKDNSGTLVQLEKTKTRRVKISVPKKRGRPKKMTKSTPRKEAKLARVSEDEESFCSGTTLSSEYAPSMKSGDDSDLGFGFSETEDGSIASTVGSSLSISDILKLPERMKCKERASSYQAKVGKLFRDLENNVVYRILGLCRLDNDDYLSERSKLLVDKLMFKYIDNEISLEDNDFDIAEDIETTPCSEMMDECPWVEWLEE